MSLIKKFAPLATASAIAVSALTLPAAATAGEFTGNIGVYSKYLLRGIAEENDGAAVQGGLDYAWDMGFYIGYWGSSLGYEYKKGTDADGEPLSYTAKGFENDIYGGFANSVGMFDYNVGLIQYVYINVDDSDLTELLVAGGIKGWTLQAQYLLTDGWWGNSGDIYWSAYGSIPLPADFGIDLKLGYYTYNDSDNDKLGGLAEAKAAGADKLTTTTSEFRHFDIGFTHPVGKTGADMAITYTVAGKDRTKTSYDDSIVMSVAWGFDI
ncbi:TorF family putative porin [Kaarinaea lacus]